MKHWLALFLLNVHFCFAQDAFHIKSFQFESTKESRVPIFKLGESIRFSFDDLIGDEAIYMYRITHCTKQWKPSTINRSEYIDGYEFNRISSSKNSFNTLQIYTHYTETIPNTNQRLLVSGNYLLEIFDQDQNLVAKRKFVVYEDIVSVGLEAKRMRDLSLAPYKQNVYVTVDAGDFVLQNPNQFLSLTLLQNGQWFHAKENIKPQYVLGSQIRYQYDDETSFYAGNEFLYFDNSDIRIPNNTVAKVIQKDVFQSYLYPDRSRDGSGYTFFADINGAFFPSIRNRSLDVYDTEADYAWVYFHLDVPKQNDPIYIAGMFNDYQFTDDYKMEYNGETGRYELALFLKQGFTNYRYYTVKGNKVVWEDGIDGNFVETENDYYALVYYRSTLDRYDRVIGSGTVKAINITN